MKKILLLLILSWQVVSCQPQQTERQINCPLEGFCIQDSLLLYDGKEIEVSTDITCLTKVLGNYDRVIEDLTRDYIKTRWYWGNDKHFAHHSSLDSLISFIPNPKGIGTEKYKTIDEIITKYGKYDSISVEEVKLEKMDNRFYSWDRLGIQATSVNDTLSSIYLYMNPPSRGITYDPRDPAYAYTGKVTINGVILDLAERKRNTWPNYMEALGISGKEYALYGDSKDWFRAKETPYFIFIFERDEGALDKMIFPDKEIPDYIKRMRIGFK